MKIQISSKQIGALGTTALLLFGATNLTAQDSPPQANFDPQQMRQQMIQRLRDQLEVPDDSEWKVISERITKVMDARRGARPGGGPGFGPFGGPGGPRRGGPPGVDAGAGGPPPGDQAPPPAFPPGGGRPPGGPMGFNPEPNPVADALHKAIESKASTAELKAKLADYKADLQQKRAALETAQQSLREVLSPRQEAIATLAGLL